MVSWTGLSRRALSILTLMTLVVVTGMMFARSSAPLQQKPATKTLIVKMAKGLPLEQAQAAVSRSGGTPKGSIPKLDLQVVEVPAYAADAITKSLTGDAAVLRVEESLTRKWQGVPSDPYYANQWALPKVAWDQVYGTVSPQFLTNVAILDTGVDAAHPDLIGSIGPGTSIIDDSNGVTDANGHGTWLAGIVAARTNNLLGVAGVAFDHVQIMPVKVLDADGLGQDSDIIAGVVWAADNGASVILMAFSNPGFSQSLQDAIDYAWSKNVVLVAAAGNDGSNTPTFPAGDKGVMGISATDQNDNLAATSNYGSSVFLAAPGVNILGTYTNQSYVTWSGTSASAAIVAGSAALMRAVDPALANGVVVNRIARTADPAGTQDQTGNGRVNVARALVDTSTDAIQPAGAAPIGNGGPFVGPYKAATTGDGSGTLTVSPTTAIEGSTGNNFQFTFTMGSTTFPNSGTITIALPSGGWSSFSSSGAGAVSIASETCGGSPSLSIAASLITITTGGGGCNNTGQNIKVNYSNATAGTTIGANTFQAQSKVGGSGSNLVNLATSPAVTVSSATPSKLAITSVNGGASVTSGTAFNVVVQSQSSSSVAANVTADTSFTLSVGAGAGTAGGTLVGTILAGTNSVTVSGVTYSNSAGENGVTLAATQTSGDPLTAGTSAAFAVIGAANKLSFNTSPASTTAGAAFGATVAVQDSVGHTVTGDTSSVTLSIAAGTPASGGPGSLSGTVTVSAVAGVATFSGLSINTAGTGYKLHAVDGGLTAADSSTFNITAGTFTKLQLLVPGETAAPGTASGKTGTPDPQTAGTAFNVTVNAVDTNWNIVSSTHTVHIASTDANATLPANAALVAGTKTLSVTLKTAGSRTITASDVTDGTKTANTSPAIQVNAGTFAKLQILAPGETAAPGNATGKTGTPTAQPTGTAFNVTVNAVDASWNAVSSTDTVHLTSTDANATLGADAPLAAGTVQISATLVTVGSQTITASDATDNTKTANTSASITVNAGPFAKLQLLLPGEIAAPGTATGKTGTPNPQTAGTAFNVTIRAVDANWNLVTTVTDTTSLTSTDPNTTMPANGALSSGSRTVAVTMKTAGTFTITASDVTQPAKPSDTSPLFTVNAGAATKLQILLPGETAAPGTATGKTGSPSSQTAGTAIPSGIVVNAVDANWNVASSAASVTITSSDANAAIADDNGATAGNLNLASGTGTLSSFTFKTAGTRTITAAATGLTSNTSANVTVNAGAFTKLQLLVPGEIAAAGTATGKTGTPTARTAGTAFTVTVNAVDANWNLVNTVTDSVSLSSSDANATLPANTPLVAGTKQLSVTLATAPSQTITATDASNGTKTPNTSPAIPVNAGTASKLVFTTSPSDSLTNIAFSTQPTVTVQDAYGNTATSSTANITLSITTGTGTPGAVLTCTTNPKAAVAGIDTFAGCRINLAGTGYQLHATASGLTAADSASFTINNGVPTTTSISPSSVARGSADFTLTVNGTAFVNGSYVQFAGSPRTTTFISATQLTATILAGDVATLGSFAITAVNPAPGGGLSNAQTLTVTRGTTTSVSCTPGSVVQGASTTCTVTVSDASGASAFPPVGTVNFSTSGGGSFAPSSCTLGSSIGNSSSCSVTYNTSAGGSQTITGAYSGSTDDIPSSGTFTLDALGTCSNFNGILEGQSAGSTAWIASNLTGWKELDLIPTRVRLCGGPAASQQFVVTFDHTKTSGQNVFRGLDDLGEISGGNFVPGHLSPYFLPLSQGVTISPPVLSAPANTDTWSYTFNVTLDGSAPSGAGFVEFRALMSAGAHLFTGSSLHMSGSPNLGTLQISLPQVAPGTPDLLLTKSAPATAAPGATITYTLNYQNKPSALNAATGVQLKDFLPAGLTYVNDSCSSCFVSGQEITWDLGTLAIGASGSVSFEATVSPSATAGTVYTNTAQINEAENDANYTDNNASADTTVTITANATIAGTVYNDADGSGTLTGGDTGLGGVTVTLSGSTSATTTTSGSGAYSFTGLTAGTYNVDYTVPAGYANTSTKPINGIVLTTGSTLGTNNFFARRTTSTSLALTTGTNPSAYGASLTFTATVTSPAGNPSSIGTVTFKDGTTVLCSAVALSGNTATCSPSLATGSYSITAEYSGTTTAPGYSGSTSAPLAQTVNTASSTTVVTVSNATYDGNPHGGTATVTGGGGLNQSLTVTYTGRNGTVYGPSTTAPTNAGDYTASASFAGDANHDASSDSKDYSILKANATITVNGYNGVYDAAAHGATGSATGVIGENLSSLLNLGDSFTNVPGGTAHWTFNAGGANSNYNSASGDAAITITKAPSTTVVTFEAPPYVYRGSAFTATATVTGVGGLNQSVGVVYSGDCTNVTVTNGCTATANFAGDTNHDASSDAKSITITKADASITVNGYSGVYDGAAHGATGSATGVIGENLTSLLNFGSSFTNVPGGTAHWTFNAGGTNANYNSAGGDAAITITKASSATVVTFEAPPYVYRGSAFTSTATVTGAGGLNQSVAVVYSGDCTNVTVANGCTATANYAGDTNHDASSDAKSITIGKAPSVTSVTFEAGPYVYRGSAFTAIAAVTGVGGLNQLLAVQYSGDCTNVTSANGCVASATYASDANHNGSSGSASITITPARIKTVLSNTNGTYPVSSFGQPVALSAHVADLDHNNAAITTGYIEIKAFCRESEDNDTTGPCTTALVMDVTPASLNDDTTILTPTLVLDGSGNATFSTSALPVGGPGFIKAIYHPSQANINNYAIEPYDTQKIPEGTNDGATPAGPATVHTGAYDFLNQEVDKAVPTVTATGNTCSYTGSACAGSGSATGIGGAGDLLTPAVTLTYDTVDGLAPVNVGTYHVTAHFAGNDNYKSGDSAPAVITISKAAPTVTATGNTCTYSGSACAGSGSATGVGGAGLTPVTLTYDTADHLAPVNAGTYHVTAHFAGDSNYSAADSAPATITINKVNLTVTADNKSKTYDGQVFSPFTATITGFVNSEGSLVVNGTVTYSGTATTATNAGGPYTITPVVSGLSATNYDFTPANGTLTINKAPVTATAGSGSATYDGATKSPAACAVTGAYTGDLTCANNPASVGPAAGTTTITPDVSGTGLTNFDITLVDGSFTISKASSVTAVSCPAGVTYNGSAQTPCTATVTGAGGLSQALTPTYTDNVNVGTATASASFAGDANHTASNDSKTFQINKASVTATAGSGSATYDGLTKSPSACAVSGVYTGDLTCANSPASVGPASGTTTITPVVSGTGLTNFDITLVNGSFTINVASSVTAVSCPAGMTYNGSAQTPCTATVTGAGGLSQTLTVSYTNNINVGTATASASFAGDANHTASSDSKTFQINKAAVTATAGGGSAAYDGLTKSPAACAVTGAYTGDLTCADSPASVGPAAGTTTIAPVVSGTGLTNFDITLVDGSFTINAASSVTAVSCPAGVTYNGTVQTPCTATVTGSGGLSQTLTVSYTNNINGGTATASASFAGDANHTASSDSKTFQISKAAVTATAGSGSAAYDGLTKSPSACAVTGAYTGDLTCANNPASVGPATGTTTITPVVSGTGLTNFDITLGTGSFTISAASSVTTVSCPANVTYNGSAQTPCTVTVTGAGILSPPPTLTYTNNINVGTATAGASFAGDANHTASSDSKTFQITKAPVTATAGSGSAAYDGLTKSPSACAVTGAYTGDLACANSPASVGPAAGTTTITPVVSGTGLTNFDMTLANGSFTISAVSSVTTVTCPTSVAYTGSAQTPCTATVTGGGLNQTLTVSYTNNINVGTATASASFAGDANHAASSDSKTFQITKAPVTATAGSGSATYDGLAKSPSACAVTGAYTGDLTCANSPASVGPAVGTTTIYPVVSGTGQTNFAITLVNGSFTISKVPSVTAVSCPASVTYNGSAQTPCTATVTGAGGLNQTLTVSYTNNVNAGTATASASFAGDANYNASSDSKTFQITKALVTATAGSGSASYDGSIKSPSACTITGDYTGGLTCANNPASAGPGAGTTTIIPVVSGSGQTNFGITLVNGSFTISKADSVTAVSCPASVTYKGSAWTPCTATVTGAGGLNQTLTVSYTNNINAGTATASASFAGDANHNASSDSKTFQISKVTLTVTADNKTRVYGAANPTFTASYSGFVGSQTLATSGITGTPALSTTADANSPVGTYPIVAALGTLSSANYNFTFVNGTLTITKATLTITALNVSKTYGDVYTFSNGCPSINCSVTGLAPSDTIAGVILTSTGAAAGAVAGTYPVTVTGFIFGSGSPSNYNVVYINGWLTILADAGQVAYIGQTLFVTSGASSTTAQVTLSASVWDITPGGGGTIGATTVTFTDLLSGKVLASGVRVTPVPNDLFTGTANTIVTLSTGQYGAQEYLIEVSLGGSYQNCLQTTNCQQTGATPGTPAYEAAHPVVTVMIPATKNTMQGSGVIPCLPTAAGTYSKVDGQCPADYPYVSYTAGFNYNNKGTNTQGKMELIIDRPDGTYYIKSNSVTSVAFTYLDSQGKPAPCVDSKACTDVTVYTKASIYKIVNGKAISIDGSVTFRMDAHDGRLTGDPDKLAFTVLSSKDGTLYYSNNWTFDNATLSYRTVLQDLQPSYTVDGKVISTVVQID